MLLAHPPTKYWIATNMGKLITSSNLRTTGTVVSSGFTYAAQSEEALKRYVEGAIDYLPYVRNTVADAISPSPFLLTVITDYSVEVLLESLRQRLDPLLPSRVSAIFAFAERRDAVKIAQRSGRPLSELFEFQLFDNPLNRVARANFGVIEILREAIYEATWDPSTLEDLAEAYWSERDDVAVEIPSPTIASNRRVLRAERRWEYLIEGRLDRVGGSLGWPQGTQQSQPQLS